MWTTRRRQREREAKSGIRLEEIREEKATEVEDRCCPSDEEARSRTSGFQSETSDHEDKAIHPRRNRGTGAFHRLTRRRPHACSIHTHVPSTRARAHRCGVAVCVRTRVLAAGFTVSEPGSLRSRLRFGVTRPRSKRKGRLGRRDARGLALLCGLDVDLPNGPTISTLSKSV